MKDVEDAVEYINRLEKELSRHLTDLKSLASLLSGGHITVDRRISGSLFMPQVREVIDILMLKETWNKMEVITVIKEVFSMVREDLKRR